MPAGIPRRTGLALLGSLPTLALAAPLPARIDTSLPSAARPAAHAPTRADEALTVRGSRFRQAPIGSYGDDPPPWEAARAIRDRRTGASTTAFGNAYNLADPLGSDERSNETGGAFLAPHHP